ncbi:MAG: hypothetical protein AB4057_15520 [Crocosphaera sp.]
MDNLFDTISQIIIQIPRDNLVFFSLISLVIALIIIVLYKRHSEKSQLIIFFFLFTSIFLFGLATLQKNSSESVSETEPAPKLTIISSDSHFGWAGSNSNKNIYTLQVYHYNNDAGYYILGQALLSDCGVSNGKIYLSHKDKSYIRIGSWSSEYLQCYEGIKSRLNPNTFGITRELEKKVRLEGYFTEIKKDVSQYIEENGSYKVKWEYSSGCCGIFIDGVDLLEVN